MRSGGGASPVRLGLLLELAVRMLRGRYGMLLRPTARVALLAVALGTLAMGLGMALLSGYRSELQAKLLEGGAALLVFPWPPGAEEALGFRIAERLQQTKGVSAVRRTGFLQAVAQGPQGEEEVTIRLGPPARGPMLQAVQSMEQLESGPFPRAVLGEELLRALGLACGDRFSVVTLSALAPGAGFRFSTVEVAGSFSTGFHEFDRSWMVLVPLAQDRSWEEIAAPVFEADLEEPSAAPRVAEQLRAELGSSALVTDWTQLNRELFAALELQQRVLFLLLSLILLVASFAMGATIAVFGRERRRDLALLQALGLSPLSVAGVVVAFTLGLATLGSGLGLLLAAFLGELVTRGGWLSFPPEVAAIYFLSSVPLRLEPIHAGAILALAIGTTLLACLLPILRLSKEDPAYLLRTE